MIKKRLRYVFPLYIVVCTWQTLHAYDGNFAGTDNFYKLAPCVVVARHIDDIAIFKQDMIAVISVFHS